MSSTPETDAAAQRHMYWFPRLERTTSSVYEVAPNAQCVPIELARRLERERDAFAKLLVADCNLLVAERDKARAERDDARADAERLRKANEEFGKRQDKRNESLFFVRETLADALSEIEAFCAENERLRVVLNQCVASLSEAADRFDMSDFRDHPTLAAWLRNARAAIDAAQKEGGR